MIVPMFDLHNGFSCCSSLSVGDRCGKPNHELLADYDDDVSTPECENKTEEMPPIDSLLVLKKADGVGEICADEPTTLYSSIDKKMWDETIACLETGNFNERVAFFGLGARPRADAPDLKTQARTWVNIKDWWGTITSQQLPIHLAIIHGAPVQLLIKLLELNPDGIRSTDLDGNLPLHLSFKHDAFDDVVGFLLKAFPEAVGVKNTSGKKPVDYAQADAGEIIQVCVDQTNRAAKKEEARLCQALEMEKSRLTEILSQLTEIRGELDHLRHVKTESNDGFTREGSSKYIGEESVELGDDLEGVEVVSHKKKKGINNKLKKLKWIKKKGAGGDYA